jgi:hypothetical protein
MSQQLAEMGERLHRGGGPVTPFESVRRLGLALRTLRGAMAAVVEAAETAGLRVPVHLVEPGAGGLVGWLDARRIDFAAEASASGVDPGDPRYQRPWGFDTDAVRADLRAIGLVPCDFWDCVAMAASEVSWCRTWPGGRFESKSRYCERHLAELRAGAAWATGDRRMVYLDGAVRPPAAAGVEAPAVATAAPDPEPDLPGGQLDLIGSPARTEGPR